MLWIPTFLWIFGDGTTSGTQLFTMKRLRLPFPPINTACRPLIKRPFSWSGTGKRKNCPFLKCQVPGWFNERTFAVKIPRHGSLAVYRENDNGITDFHFETHAADLLNQEELNLLPCIGTDSG